jgi:RNA polymerase sigma-70 factor (ECF subfamily)
MNAETDRTRMFRSSQSITYNVFMPQASSDSDCPPAMRFASTQWSLVLAARGDSSAENAAALAALCTAYWQPLYGYVRRRGYSVEDAQDLTQSYFSRLLEKRFLDQADARRGRFRAFLLASLKNFMINEWHREHAQKRGGDRFALSLDERHHAEALYAAGQAAGMVIPLSPEKQYERSWALAVLNRVTAQVAAEFTAAGKEAIFEGLKTFLTGDAGELKYSQAAALGMGEGAARVAVYRMRGRFRDVLRAEIARTLAAPADSGAIEEELRFLLAAL